MNAKPYDKIWAVLSVDKNGNEGICAINTPIGPQVAVTGEKFILDMYLKEITKGKDEARNAQVSIVLAEFTRTKSRAIFDKSKTEGE